METMLLRHNCSKRTATINLLILMIMVIVVGGTPWSKLDDTGASRVPQSMPGTLSFVDPCYDAHDRAQRCVPDFVNAAFGRPVQATSTCGDPPSRLPASLSGCGSRPYSINSPVKTGKARWRSRRRHRRRGRRRDCATTDNDDDTTICDASKRSHSHPASLLTDLNNPSNRTCWISAPSASPTNNSSTANLTVSFGKKYEVTYISLQFCAPGRPDHSVALYKSVDYGGTWSPFQFFSDQCRRVFGRQFAQSVNRSNEQHALCTDFGDVSKENSINPHDTYRLAFSTLEGRPSAHEFESSPVLQDWVTATDIRIVFRPTWPEFASNTLEDNRIERRRRERRRRRRWRPLPPPTGSLHYSLADVAVGGRCKCNGHASRCLADRHDAVWSTAEAAGVASMRREMCDCRHNTAGVDCERCKPFHYDRPWARATPDNANECVDLCLSAYLHDDDAYSFRMNYWSRWIRSRTLGP